jgi:hypothetical protein
MFSLPAIKGLVLSVVQRICGASLGTQKTSGTYSRSIFKSLGDWPWTAAAADTFVFFMINFFWFFL